MFKPLSKLLLLIALLVAFVGQSMAYHFIGFDDVNLSVNAEVQTLDDGSNLPLKRTLQTKNSQETENSQQQEQAPLQNDSFDDNVVASDEVDDCCDIDCCDGECFCPANACSSLAFLDNTLGYSKIVVANELVLPFVHASPQYIVTSLYRPPIFTS